MQFKPRRSSRTLTVVIALTAALIVFSVWVLFVSGGGFALSMVALTAAIVVIVLMDTARLGWYYTVEEDGIRVKRTFKRYRIAAESIASVKDIGSPKVRSIIRRAQEGKPRAVGKAQSGTASVGTSRGDGSTQEGGPSAGGASSRSGPSGGGASSKGSASGGKVNRQVELGRIIGFSSVPISLGRQPGGANAAGSAAVVPEGRFVLVVKKDGRQYLLTPRQPEEFVRACRKIGLGK